MGSFKDRKAIIILVALVLILLPYYYIYVPKQEENKQEEVNINNLQNRYNELLEKTNSKEAILEEIEQLKAKIEEYNHAYPVVVTQEEMVMFMEYIYANSNLKIMSSTISPFEVYHTGVSSGEVITESNTNQTSENSENDITTEIPVGTVNGITLTGNETAYVSAMSFTYEGSYDELLSFFNYLRDYTKEVKLSSIGMNYEPETRKFTGDIKFDMFAIAGDGRIPDVVPDYPGIIGKETIISGWIDQYASEVDGEAYESNKTELTVSLTSPYADMAPVIIGVKGDLTGNSEAKVVNNLLNNVVIEITNNGAEYFAEYKINGASKGKIKIDVDKTIDIDVFSQKRADNIDKVGILTTVINKTAKTVNVRVYNDDAERPRFTISATEGDVIVSRQ